MAQHVDYGVVESGVREAKLRRGSARHGRIRLAVVSLFYVSRNSRFNTLPVAVIGKASRNSIVRGYL